MTLSVLDKIKAFLSSEGVELEAGEAASSSVEKGYRGS